MSTSCASLYTALYAPSEIKQVDGELTFAISAKAYEVLHQDDNKFVEQETTTTVLWQYKTPDGEYHWFVNRDYREAEATDFWETNFKLDQTHLDSEDYGGKCKDMTPKAYNHYCINPETGENFKIRQFPWGEGYGYFVALVGDKYTIIYSLPIGSLSFY